MAFIYKWYYILTKYLPRPLPQSELEFSKLKELFTTVYGLEDHPQVWYTVASQLTAGPPTSLYRSYGNMVNVAKRLKVAALAQIEKQYASQDLERRLKEEAERLTDAFKKEEERKRLQRERIPHDTRDIIPDWSDVPGQPHPPVPEGTPSVQTELQSVPGPSSGLVQSFSENGL